MDYYEGKGGYEIVEREDGYFDVSSGPALYFKKYEDWPKYEQEAIKHAKGITLDVGVGAGRVCLYLQEKKIKCLGIDISPLAIKTCQMRGVNETKLMPFENVTRLTYRFGTIVMFGNNFGLFRNKNNARKLLKELYFLTTEDAVILAESNDPYQTTVKEHLDYHAYNLSKGRMAGELIIRVRYKKYITPWFAYLIVSRAEMRQIVEGTGWHVSHFIKEEESAYVAIIEKH
jgi:SAM-dependent methyltransferase